MTVLDLLSRPIYAFADVDRLTGLTPGTARRWIDGYRRAGRTYAPILRPQSTGDERVTWGEMVEAGLVAKFRDSKLPVNNLRPAVERLREQFGDYPLARARPLLEVSGRELVMQIQDDIQLSPELQLVVVRNGQLVLAPVVQEFRNRVDYRGEIAVSLKPRAQTPSVMMDPQLAFGQPALRAVRTEVVAEDFRAGSDRESLADLYDLTADQVDQALRFEMIVAGRRVA